MKRTRDDRRFASIIAYCPTGKPCYDKRGAITAKNARWREAHVELRIYPCSKCRAWHLSSRL